MSPLNTAPQAPASTTLESQKFRSQMGQISRHSAVFFAGTMFTAVAGYLFKVYLARVLGAEALGIYALGMTVGGLLGLFAALGLPQAAARYVALYRANDRPAELNGFLWRGLGIMLIASLAVGAVMMLLRTWIANRFYHTPALAGYMWAFVVIMIVGALNVFYGQVLAGFKDVARRTVITNFIASPLNMVFCIGLFAVGLRLTGYLLAQIASSLIALVLLAYSVWRMMQPGYRSPTHPLPRLESGAILFSASLFAVQALEYSSSQLDKIALGFFLNARSVGIYAVATSMTTFIGILLQSVNQIFSPTITDLHARGEIDLLRRLYRTLTKWVLGFTMPLATVVCIFAAPLMQIFGDQFRPGWPVLIIGTAGQLINCAVGSVGLLLLMSGNQDRVVKIQVKVALANALFNILLIPIWGIIGASLVAAATNASINLLYLREVKKVLGLSPYDRTYSRLILPAGLAMLVAVAIRLGTLHADRPVLWIVTATLAAYSLFTCLMLLIGLNEDDRFVLQAVTGKLKAVLAFGN